jgi:polypeptide N-acetylgalactosaminyltransferase
LIEIQKCSFFLQVQNVQNPNLCIDTLNNGEKKPIGLYPCALNHTHPYHNQNFALSYYRDLKEANGDKCWDVSDSKPGTEVLMYNCHQGQGNQMWRYEQVMSYT